MSVSMVTVRAMRLERLFARIARAEVGNVAFNDLVRLLEALGFEQIGGRGSHRVFARPDVVELVNLQGVAGRRSGARRGRSRADPPLRFETGGQAMNARYQIEVSWSDEDQVWVADVPGLPFCSAHGRTPHQAVEEVELAVDACLEAAHNANRSAPPPSLPAR